MSYYKCNCCGTLINEPGIYLNAGLLKHQGFIRSGEYREPKAGERYLSGAKPEAYKTLNDLSDKFYIVKPIDNGGHRTKSIG